MSYYGSVDSCRVSIQDLSNLFVRAFINVMGVVFVWRGEHVR